MDVRLAGAGDGSDYGAGPIPAIQHPLHFATANAHCYARERAKANASIGWAAKPYMASLVAAVTDALVELGQDATARCKSKA
jgi:hypothetical protein